MKLAAEERLIVALDMDETEKAIQLVNELKDCVETFKVGKELFVSAGPKIIQEIQSLNKKIFLDLKFHDIPNTVSKASISAIKQGVYMFDLHIAGGREMMEQTVKASRQFALEQKLTRPLIIGVTVLTSLNDEQLNGEIGIQRSVDEQVEFWAKLARKVGLDGVVSSPREVKRIKKFCGNDFLTVVPGVRPDWAGKNDQKRIMTPKEAIRAGADFLVVGRPITQAEQPVAAAQKILKEIKEGMEC